MNFLYVTLTAVLAFFVTILIFLPIIKRVKAKKLSISFNDNVSRPYKMVPFGGIAMFAGILIPTSVVGAIEYSISNFLYIFLAVLVLFIVGIFQETKESSSWKKLLAYSIVSIILVVFGDVRIIQFHNVFGLNRISDFLSYSLSFVFIIFVILAYSNFPRMDRLIEGLGGIAGLSFGIWFLATRQMQFAILAFAFLGSMLAFYAFNIFSRRRKMILGKTGMQIVGLLIAFMAIVTNEFETSHSFQPLWVSNPVFVFAIIGLPVIEIIRLFVLNLIRGKSIYSSDSNHIYNEIYLVTRDHIEATNILVLFCVVMVISSVILNIVGIHVYYQLIVLFFELFLLYSFSFSYFRNKYKKFRKRLVPNRSNF